MSDIRFAAIHSLGCRVNSYESQAMEQALSDAGYQIVPFDERADVYVINTCTVTAVSDKKSRQMIRRARRRNPDGVVVACGCYAQKDLGDIGEFCDIILGNNHKSELIERIDEFIKNRDAISCISDIHGRDTAYEYMSLNAPESHTRGFIKVQDGCNRYCSYCIIPTVRGVSRSRSIEDICREAESFAGRGCREIVLSAINLSDYEYNGSGLGELVLALERIRGISRIRLGSLEPDVFDDEFVSVLKSCEKICPHFHFSLQSACDETLREMGRGYTVGICIDAVKRLKAAYPDPAICADVIAGFPGETKKQHEESLNNIKNMGLFELHVFPYSKREGTKAADRPDQLSNAVKEARAAEYLDLSKKLSLEYVNRLMKKECSVLFEEERKIGEDTYWCGHTAEYIRVACKSDENLSNGIFTCKPERIMDAGYMEVSLLF